MAAHAVVAELVNAENGDEGRGERHADQDPARIGKELPQRHALLDSAGQQGRDYCR